MPRPAELLTLSLIGAVAESLDVSTASFNGWAVGDFTDAVRKIAA
jgi:hypothetical protein